MPIDVPMCRSIRHAFRAPRWSQRHTHTHILEVVGGSRHLPKILGSFQSRGTLVLTPGDYSVKEQRERTKQSLSVRTCHSHVSLLFSSQGKVEKLAWAARELTELLRVKIQASVDFREVLGAETGPLRTQQRRKPTTPPPTWLISYGGSGPSLASTRGADLGGPVGLD